MLHRSPRSQVVRRTATTVFLLLGLSGCSSATTPGAIDGAELFARPSIGGLDGCGTCHTPTADRTSIGPSLAGIAGRAGERIAGVSAQEYLTTSILNPDAFYIEGFGAGMPGYGGALTTAEVEALVAYLLTFD